MRLLLLSRYGRLGASSRLRSYQYLPYLHSKGFLITVVPLLNDDYITGLYNRGHIPLTSVIKSYWTRLQWMRRAADFDAVWVEKEMLPWIPKWLELRWFPSRIPMIVDYDDAIFHRYDRHRLAIVRAILGRKIDAVMRRASLVMAGNEYLADRAERAGAQRVEILPTVVDTQRYEAIRLESAPITIGWIGSPMTAHYLQLIAPALRTLTAKRNIRVVAVGAGSTQLEQIPLEVLQWTEATEVAEIQRFDIGIMPLPDEPFERGKCGYKLIQYMACGKPVVASPVGVNTVIVRNGLEGFLASSPEEWILSLQKLVDDPALRYRMGQAGRARVETEYSLQVAAPKLERLLFSTAKGSVYAG